MADPPGRGGGLGRLGRRGTQSEGVPQCCRPDALLAVSRLSQYLNNPSKMHMKHAQFLLTYLYTTRNQGITYGKIIHGITGHSLNEFYGFSDADYAGNVDNRRSTTGWVFMYNGGAISWRSFLQHVTALSSSESEYMAISDAAKEARSLLKLQGCFDTNNFGNIVIYEDNRGCEK